MACACPGAIIKLLLQAVPQRLHHVTAHDFMYNSIHVFLDP
jgi:hypothetical protein